eukprot:scaffold8351_cov147-Isochrysis_galbana.AAC.1
MDGRLAVFLRGHIDALGVEHHVVLGILLSDRVVQRPSGGGRDAHRVDWLKPRLRGVGVDCDKNRAGVPCGESPPFCVVISEHRSGEGPILGGSAGRGGGGAQLVGSMPPSKLRRGWVEVGRGVALFPVVRVHPPRRSWRWCPAGGEHTTLEVGERVGCSVQKCSIISFGESPPPLGVVNKAPGGTRPTAV